MEGKSKEMTSEDISEIIKKSLPKHIRDFIEEECERLRQQEKAKQYYEKNKDKIKLIEPGTPEWEIIERFIEKRKLK